MANPSKGKRPSKYRQAIRADRAKDSASTGADSSAPKRRGLIGQAINKLQQAVDTDRFTSKSEGSSNPSTHGQPSGATNCHPNVESTAEATARADEDAQAHGAEAGTLANAEGLTNAEGVANADASPDSDASADSDPSADRMAELPAAGQTNGQADGELSSPSNGESTHSTLTAPTAKATQTTQATPPANPTLPTEKPSTSFPDHVTAIASDDAPLTSTSLPKSTPAHSSSSTQEAEPYRKDRGHQVKLATRLIVSIGSLVLAVIIFIVLIRTAPQVEPKATGARAIKVPAITLEPLTLARPWQATGTVQASHKAAVPARVSATVERIPANIDEGKRVAKGQTLAQLDASDFNQRLTSAKQSIAQLRAQLSQLDVTKKRLAQRKGFEQKLLSLSQDDFGRLQKIYKNRAGTRQDVDAARKSVLQAQRSLSDTSQQLESIPAQRAELKANINALQANLELAQLNRQRTNVQSPIAGIIEELSVQPGENVKTGQTVAQVVDLRTLEAHLNVPAAARSDIAVGSVITLHAAAKPQRTWQAKVSRIQPVDDPESRTMRVYAKIAQPNAHELFGTKRGTELLTPGTFVTASVQGTHAESHWVVPRRAVRDGRILVIDDGAIESHAVTIDYSLARQFKQFGINDDQWVVLERSPSSSGSLGKGDKIVANVATTFREGQRVEPVPARRAKPRKVGPTG